MKKRIIFSNKENEKNYIEHDKFFGENSFEFYKEKNGNCSSKLINILLKLKNNLIYKFISLINIIK